MPNLHFVMSDVCVRVKGMEGTSAGCLLKPSESAVLRAVGQLHGQRGQGDLCSGPFSCRPALPCRQHPSRQRGRQPVPLWVGVADLVLPSICIGAAVSQLPDGLTASWAAVDYKALYWHRQCVGNTGHQCISLNVWQGAMVLLLPSTEPCLLTSLCKQCCTSIQFCQ